VRSRFVGAISRTSVRVLSALRNRQQARSAQSVRQAAKLDGVKPVSTYTVACELGQ